MDSTRPKPFVFVLMPFADDFEDIYKAGIKPAVQEAGGYCERLDEQMFHESMMERIYNQISKADLIVADMTGRNPNVFYEVGYAHALGKKVILLTQKSEDIPFDLKHYLHIVYEGKIAQLKDKLFRQVAWYLEADTIDSTTPESHRILQYHVGTSMITEGADITVVGYFPDETSERRNYGVKIQVSLSIHNPSNSIVKTDFRLALVFPIGSFVEPSYRRAESLPVPVDATLPDGRYLVLMDLPYSEYFPGISSSMTFLLATSWPDTSPETDGPNSFGRIPVVLRFLLRYGAEDVAFTMKPERPKPIRP